MIQLISVLISFLFIPILIRLKVKLSYTLLIAAGILTLISGLGLKVLGQVILNVFINSSSRETILTVMMVGILGGLMKHYKILDRVVNTMLIVIRNKKNVLMIIPSMTGMLPIPGGALLSAPFINSIGEEMEVFPSRRAAINLVFRHIPMFILPYSTSLLLVAALLPDINIFILILLNLVSVISIIAMGYYFFLKDINLDISSPRKNIRKDLITLLIYISPIYVPVIISAITGLDFYITLIVSVFIVYLLGDKKDFLKVIIKSINFNTILSIIGILMIKEVILNMEDLLKIFSDLLNVNNGMLSMIITLFISSCFFGIITGSQAASLAIVLPMLSQIDINSKVLYIYIYFIFGATFIGYFSSPLHLCQVFTLEHMNVPTSELYKEYKYYLPMLSLILIISVLVLKLIFLI